MATRQERSLPSMSKEEKDAIDGNDQKYYREVESHFDYDEYGDKRFQKFEEREFRSDLPQITTEGLNHGRYGSKWCGSKMLKGPLELGIYCELLQDLRPATIIETGTWCGGTAAWLSDHCKMFGIETQIYSIDLNHDNLDDRSKRDNIKFFVGDNFKIEESFPTEMLKKLPHPWLVSEDTHVNVLPVLEHFTEYMQPGDYMIVEDTAPNQPLIMGMGLIKKLGWTDVHKELEKFMKQSGGDKLRVDRYYTDLYGYNASAHWNAFLKRI